MRKLTATLCLTIAVLLGSTGSGVGKVSRGGALNMGSSFAGGILCEKYKHIPRGQVVRLMNKLQSLVSENEWKLINKGYQKGLKEHAVYSKNYKKWVKYTLNKKFCRKDVQFMIDTYKQRLFP
jgi:hypothetical protein